MCDVILIVCVLCAVCVPCLRIPLHRLWIAPVIQKNNETININKFTSEITSSKRITP